MTTNAAGHLPAYLAALGRVTYPAWDLWVVDNGSSDGSPGLVAAAFPEATVLRNDANLGFTGACNQALRLLLAGATDYRGVLFLNDDTEVTPGFIEPLVALADDGTLVAPRCYLAGQPGVLDDSAGDFDWLRGKWKESTLGTSETATEGAPRGVGAANLSCLLVPLQVFRTIGLLDDAFFAYYDDTDFCRRAGDAGFRILVEPASIVYHRKGATLGGQLSVFGCYYLTRNRPYLMRKHLGRGPRFLAFLVYFLTTRAVRMVLWAKAGRFDLCRATLRGLRDFFAGRMGAGKPGRARDRGTRRPA